MEADAEADFTLAWVGLAQGRRMEAEAQMGSRMSMNDRGHRMQGRSKIVLMGRLAMAQGRSGQALGLFRQALEENAPVYSLDWFEDCLGDALFELGRYPEAEAEYIRALTKFPGVGLTRYRLAVAYERAGKPAMAQAEYRRFLEEWNTADHGISEVAAAKSRLR